MFVILNYFRFVIFCYVLINIYNYNYNMRINVHNYLNTIKVNDSQPYYYVKNYKLFCLTLEDKLSSIIP